MQQVLHMERLWSPMLLEPSARWDVMRLWTPWRLCSRGESYSFSSCGEHCCHSWTASCGRREGDAREELLTLIDEEEKISLLVLGADTQSETAGPLISFLMAKGASKCRVPITIVPGNLSDEQIDALF